MLSGLLARPAATATCEEIEKPVTTAQSRKIFVNLPITDLDRSVAFFTALGFAFDARFTDDEATCLIISDEAFVMLLVQERFEEFTTKAVCDATTHTEAILALTADSRADVDAVADTALAAGGLPQRTDGHGVHVRTQLLRPRRALVGGLSYGPKRTRGVAGSSCATTGSAVNVILCEASPVVGA